MSNTKTIHHLPIEMIDHIISFLSLSDRKRASLVCHQWESLCFSPKYLNSSILLRVTFEGEATDWYDTIVKSTREYGQIMISCWRDKDSAVAKILDKFHGSLESVTLEGYRYLDYETTTEYLVELFASFSNLKELRILTMVRIKDEEDHSKVLEKVTTFPNMLKLEILVLAHSSLEFIDWRTIAPNLKHFYVSRNKQNNTNFNELLHFYSGQLNSLGITVDDKKQFSFGPQPISFPQVKRLTATCWDAPIEQARDFFGAFPALTELNYGFEMSSEILTLIVGAFPLLSRIRLYWSLPDDGFELLSKLSKLKHLYLYGTYLGSSMLESANCFPSLEQLTLDVEEIVDCEEFYDIVRRKMPKLINLEVDGMCSSTEDVFTICNHLHNLQRLAVKNVDMDDSDDSFQNMHRLNKLSELCLDFTVNKTVFSWIIFSRCPSIRTMYISADKIVEHTPEGHQQLAEKFPSLTKLQFDKSFFSEAEIGDLKTALPQCEISVGSRVGIFQHGTDDGTLQPMMCINS